MHIIFQYLPVRHCELMNTPHWGLSFYCWWHKTIGNQFQLIRAEPHEIPLKTTTGGSHKDHSSHLVFFIKWLLHVVISLNKSRQHLRVSRNAVCDRGVVAPAPLTKEIAAGIRCCHQRVSDCQMTRIFFSYLDSIMFEWMYFVITRSRCVVCPNLLDMIEEIPRDHIWESQLFSCLWMDQIYEWSVWCMITS